MLSSVLHMLVEPSTCNFQVPLRVPLSRNLISFVASTAMHGVNSAMKSARKLGFND